MSPHGDERPGVSWNEHFRGWLAFGLTDFNQAMLPEHRVQTRATVAVAIADLDRFLDEYDTQNGHPSAQVTGGSVECAGFGGPLSIDHGTFQAFVPAADEVPADMLHQRMRYDLALTDLHGAPLRLLGFKLIENDPGYDSWSDTTTLFVRVFGAAPTTPPVAVGVLRISPRAFMRQLASFRGAGRSPAQRARSVARFGQFFAGGLARAYLGGPAGGTRPSFPQDAPKPAWRRTGSAGAGAAGEFVALPGRNLARAVVPYEVPDLPFGLNLHRLRRLDGDGRPVAPTREPVLLVPGSGVRAQMYYGQPVGPSFAEYLLDHGYDVWAQTWRASIDLPGNPYTWDHAAKYDHPAAVRTVLEAAESEGGDGAMKAVVHCQGSISFMMAAAAGWLDPRLTQIVSSAVSLFIDVRSTTYLKQRMAVPTLGRMFAGVDAQWGIRPVTPSAALFAAVAKRSELQCGNPSCQVANYMYGSGSDVLLRHRGDDGEPWLAPAVHAWLGREMGYTPMSLIGQVAQSSRHGYVVPAPDAPAGTPASYVAGAPRTQAQVTFIAGDCNRMFDWQGQRRAKEFFDRSLGPGRADFVKLPGYGHLDTFWGRLASRDVFPVILRGLEWQPGRPPPSAPGAGFST